MKNQKLQNIQGDISRLLVLSKKYWIYEHIKQENTSQFRGYKLRSFDILLLDKGHKWLIDYQNCFPFICTIIHLIFGLIQHAAGFHCSSGRNKSKYLPKTFSKVSNTPYSRMEIKQICLLRHKCQRPKKRQEHTLSLKRCIFPTCAWHTSHCLK